CAPMPNTVQWETSSAPQWSHWIWFPEGEPTIDAPIEARFFRREFTLPKNIKTKRATLHIAADDKAIVWLNGKKIAEVNGFSTAHTLDLTASLRSGKNVIALQANNLPAPVKLNPAGLLLALEIVSENGNTIIAGDAEWRAAKQAPQGWQEIAF